MQDLARTCNMSGLASALLLLASAALGHASAPAPDPQASRLLADARARQPLVFTPYSDRKDPQIAFTARSAGYQVALHRNGTLVQWATGSTADQRMELLGTRASTPAAERPLPANAWADGPAFGAVTYRHLYPGVDVTYHSRLGALEYDFSVAPGADPGLIRLSFSNAKQVTVEPATGALLVTGSDGVVVQHSRPELYQQEGAARREIAGRYRLLSSRVVGFDVGAYDRSRRLIIDPTINVSRILFGNSNENAYGVAVDASGNSYVTGVTYSAYSFPAGTGASVVHGRKDCSLNRPCPNSAFIVKIDPAGNIVAQVLFGGTGNTRPAAIAVDGNYVYVVGSTDSPTITTAAGRPATVNKSYGAAATDHVVTIRGGAKAFLAKFSPTLSNLSTVTTLSSSAGAAAHGLAIDSSGSAYLTGEACGMGFWLTSGAYQNDTHASCDVFVTHLDYFGSFGYGPNYSARFGGFARDYGNAIAVDATGAAWVAGRTCSPNFPATPGLSHGLDGAPGCNATLTKLDASGSTYQYSMYFGGPNPAAADLFRIDEAMALTLNGTSGAWVGGSTEAGNFYTVAPPGHVPLQASPPCTLDPRAGTSCGHTGFVTYVDAGLNIIWSTFLGGSNMSSVNALAKNSRGEIYATGEIYQSAAGFPGATPTNFISGGGYVTKLSGSLESVSWTNLFAGPVRSIVARGNSISTGLWTAGDTYPNSSTSDSFMIKMTDAVASGGVGGVCTTCLVGR